MLADVAAATAAAAAVGVSGWICSLLERKNDVRTDGVLGRWDVERGFGDDDADADADVDCVHLAVVAAGDAAGSGVDGRAPW